MGGCLIYFDSPVFVSTMLLRLLYLKMKVDEPLLNLKNSRVSGVLLVNYCKGIDMVDHNLLLLKLEGYGFTNRAYNWCQSYLSGRRQLVCIDGKESSLTCVNHGVPQGSILGPLFFILFIKDLPLYITEQGRRSINPTPPLPFPLYHGGGMILRVRPRVQCAFSSQYITFTFALICLRTEIRL